MEIWSVKPIHNSNLKVFRALMFAHIKKDKLDVVRVVKYGFVGYLEGVTDYKMRKMELRGLKNFISKNVVFDETHI